MQNFNVVCSLICFIYGLIGAIPPLTIITVVDHQGPTLMGRDLPGKLKLDLQAVFASQVHLINSENSSNPVRDFPKLFKPALGRLEGIKAKKHVNARAVPIYQKAMPLPFIDRELVEDELSRLENLGVIEPVKFSEGASHIVPVCKANGKLRLCGNYKSTINNKWNWMKAHAKTQP